ncbi:MAG: ATP-binding protein [Desulfomonilia bacterium]|nr:ATP-binding protein [Desulfomonilia bacterium]
MKRRSRAYYEKRLRYRVGRAISDYRMIQHGDRVIVAVSGGKDSLVLMKILSDLSGAAPVEFTLIPVHISTGYEQDFDRVADWVETVSGQEIIRIEANIREILSSVSDPEKSPCALCSRLRRGRLYSYAQEIKADSIALGHHMDDIIETFFLRCFYTGQIGAMAPSRVSDDGKNRVIRPLAYCPSHLIDDNFSFFHMEPVSLNCPIRPDGKREVVRRYLSVMEREIPQLRYSLFGALGNVDEKSLCIRESVCACPH